MQKKVADIIPEQKTGKAIDTISSVEGHDESDAKKYFIMVKERLQSVYRWKRYAGTISADFQLVNKLGKEVKRKAKKGDYFKIDILGPGSKSGGGYDWVRIEEVVSTSGPDAESFGFRVRPTDNPQKTHLEVSHFYSRVSTSTFVVERNKNKITVSIYDRNTTTNTGANDRFDKIRDSVVGTAAIITFSKIQWKNLADGLLKRS